MSYDKPLIDTLATNKTHYNWTFTTPAGSTGTFYIGGFYGFGATANDFDPSITHGTSNSAYAAHFFIVLGATPSDTLTIRVTGTSITDAGVRTGSDTEDIVVDGGDSTNDYFETTKKWLGQVTISVVSGTPVACNYGYCKYYDHGNERFTLVGWEVTWIGGASDTGANIQILHHKATGWTYNAGAPPTPPTALASMVGDYVTERNITSDHEGAWKRTGFSQDIRGDLTEGTIIAIITSVSKAFDIGNVGLDITSAALT